MSKLYDLTRQLIELSELANNPDVPPEALADTLEALEGEFEAKAVSICHVLLNTDGDVTAIDAEIKRLQDRKKFKIAGKERLKAYLRDNMQRLDITKLSSPLFTITLRKPTKAVNIIDESLIAENFAKHQPQVSVHAVVTVYE